MGSNHNHVSSPAWGRAKLEDQRHARNHLDAKTGNLIKYQTLNKVTTLDSQLPPCWSISLKCRMSLNPSATPLEKKFKRNNTTKTFIKTMSVLKAWAKAVTKGRKDSSS